MNAAAVVNLTKRSLHNIRDPIILHVKYDQTQIEYNHYELFLGMRNDKLLVMDPPNPVRLLEFRELSTRWDGAGLVVSSESIDAEHLVFASERRLFLIYVVLAAVTAGLVHVVQRRRGESWTECPVRQRVSRSALGTCVIIAGAILVGTLQSSLDTEGFWAYPEATKAVQQAHFGHLVTKVNVKDLRQLLQGTDVTVVDARMPRDYEAGHIEGALSIPVDADAGELQRAVANIPKGKRVVLYCQSHLCPYADKIGARLQADGYTDLSIFKGGWQEWERMRRSANDE